MNLLHRSLLTSTALAVALVGPSLAHDLAEGLGVPQLAACLEDVDTAQAAFIRRGKIRQRASSSYRVVVVVGDDSGNNDVDHVEVELVPECSADSDSADSAVSASLAAAASAEAEVGEPTGITLELGSIAANGNKRFIGTFEDIRFGCPAPPQRSAMVSTMVGPDGTPHGEVRTEVLEIERDAPAATNVTLRRLDGTRFKLAVTVSNDFASEVAAVELGFVDYAGPSPLAADLSLEEVETSNARRRFTDATVAFEDPEAAVGETYVAVVDLKDAEGQSLGATEHEVVVWGGTYTEIQSLRAWVAEAQEREAQLVENLDQMSELAAELQRGVEEQPDTPIVHFNFTVDSFFDIWDGTEPYVPPPSPPPPSCTDPNVPPNTPCL